MFMPFKIQIETYISCKVLIALNIQFLFIKRYQHGLCLAFGRVLMAHTNPIWTSKSVFYVLGQIVLTYDAIFILISSGKLGDLPVSWRTVTLLLSA